MKLCYLQSPAVLLMYTDRIIVATKISEIEQIQ